MQLHYFRPWICNGFDKLGDEKSDQAGGLDKLFDKASRRSEKQDLIQVKKEEIPSAQKIKSFAKRLVSHL